MTHDIFKYDDGGRLHRDDGPAVIYANGDQYWYHSGKIHRDDGPAVTKASVEQYWFRNGKNITVAMKKWISVRNIDLANLSDQDKQELKMYMVSL